MSLLQISKLNRFVEKENKQVLQIQTLKASNKKHLLAKSNPCLKQQASRYYTQTITTHAHYTNNDTDMNEYYNEILRLARKLD